ncbi:hypothetical protein [Myroides odoratimimus]|uniref:hypothetical protein n=1 Tax=Myroides odoratimimus TaxID=76832 RepID=UPI001CE08AB4|nr:hypothetical protein [Myroides odoratimimus]MCA4807015.1 hypothetical protein [Myroides odoratimimus]
MKKTLSILTLLALSFTGISCSSDDNSKVNPITEKNQLIGEWQLKTIKFTKFVESGIPANDACMVEGLRGYSFKEDKTFSFIVGKESSFDPSAKKYWEWSGDEKAFEIKQINPSMPPYNFGFKPTNITITKDREILSLSFSANLSNGSSADFLLEKKIVDNQPAKVYMPDGSEFSCELFNKKTIQQELEQSTWVLDKGQVIFKANFTDVPSQGDRAKSILSFSFLKQNKSFIRYTFPMGVASAKADTWVFDDKDNSFSTTYISDSFGGNDLRFKVKVTKISDTKMEFNFQDDKGTSEKRIFVKHTVFLQDEQSQSNLDNLLNDLLTKTEKK